MEDSQDLSEQSVSTNVAKFNGINWTLFNQVVWKDFTVDLKIVVRSGEIFWAPNFKPFSLYIKWVVLVFFPWRNEEDLCYIRFCGTTIVGGI